MVEIPLITGEHVVDFRLAGGVVGLEGVGDRMVAGGGEEGCEGGEGAGGASEGGVGGEELAGKGCGPVCE